MPTSGPFYPKDSSWAGLLAIFLATVFLVTMNHPSLNVQATANCSHDNQQLSCAPGPPMKLRTPLASALRLEEDREPDRERFDSLCRLPASFGSLSCCNWRVVCKHQ
jgi:hypothetical protein